MFGLGKRGDLTMIATDPLSLVFIGCFVVSGTFLILSSVLGFGHAHFHLGHIGHAGHAGGVGHASGVMHHALPQPHAGAHAAHAPHVGTHTGTANAQQATGAQVNPPLWASMLSMLNLYAILTFLFWFGLIGYVLHNLTNFGSLSAFVGALLVGVVGAVIINMVMGRLMNKDDGELTAESSEMVGTIATVSMAIRAGGIGEVIYTKGAGGRKSIGARSADSQPIARDAEVVIVSYEKGIAQVQTWDRFISEHDELEEFLRTQQREDTTAQQTDAISSNPIEQP
jgi:membrane protein implicated in regulation of membrane protease activity